MPQEFVDPQSAPSAGAQPPDSTALREQHARVAAPSRPVWQLLGGLGLLCASLVALDTLVLPAALPALAWGPPRPVLAADRAVGMRFGGRFADPAAVATIRSEILRAAEAQGGPQSVEPIRRMWRLPPASAAGGPQEVRLAGPQRGQGTPPPPIRSEGPRTFLVPFGVHRSGAEGAGLYGASLVALTALSGLLAFLLPARLRVIRGALLSGGMRNLLRLTAVGAVAYGLFLLLVLFLYVLVVGLPFAVLLLFLLGPGTLVGLVAASLTLGRWLVRFTRTAPKAPLVELVAGTLALYAASIVPFVGWVAFGLAAALGLGAVVVTRLGTGDPWSLTELA